MGRRGSESMPGRVKKCTKKSLPLLFVKLFFDFFSWSCVLANNYISNKTLKLTEILISVKTDLLISHILSILVLLKVFKINSIRFYW